IDTPNTVKEAIRNKHVRGITEDAVDEVIGLYDSMKSLDSGIQKMRAERNKIADLIPQTTDPIEKQKHIDEGKKLKEDLQLKDQEYRLLEEKYTKLLSFIPNVPSTDTPNGVDDKDNVEVRTWGTKPIFDFEPKGHYELLTNLGLLDTERGSKVSGF